MYSPNHPKVWGRAKWDNFFHTAFWSPKKFTGDEPLIYQDWLKLEILTLPCMECQINAGIFLSSHTIPKFQSRNELIQYLIQLRNHADEMTGNKNKFNIHLWKFNNLQLKYARLAKRGNRKR